MIMKSFKNNQIINLSEVDIRNKQITACNDKKSLRGKHPNSLKNLKPYPKGVVVIPLESLINIPN